MAAIADMGEVDEMHSKEEGSVVTNGDLCSDVDMENADSQDSLKRASLSEPMEVDQIECNSETKDTEKISDTVVEQSEINQDESSQEEVENETKSDDATDKIVSESETETEESNGRQNESKEEEKSETVDNLVENKEDPVNETSEADISEQISKEDESKESKKDEVKDVETEKVNKVDTDKPNEVDMDKPNEVETEKINEVDAEKVKEVDADKVNEVEEIHEIHEIESDDDSVKESKISNDETIELNDSGGEGDGDVMIVDSPPHSPKANGTEIIDLETPEKKIVEKRKEVTPRRSTRNLNKSKSYVESDKESEPEEEVAKTPHYSEESDIEEVLPQDPLACNDALSIEKVTVPEKPKPPGKPSTIVVKDTKRLVEIASKQNSNIQGKKEPTLVIIDTNSILSGKGPVPVNSKSAPIPSSVPSYPTVLPVALPAQGMYPPNMRATITPIPVNATNITSTAPPKTSPATITPTLNLPPLLPSLTDDMFVVEAPSFIVPYVYEKPPSKDIKDFMKELEEQIKADKSDEDKDKDDDKTEEDKSEESKSQEDEKRKEDEPMKTRNDVRKEKEEEKKPYSFFNSPLGKFFINIGFNLVQEQVQTDLLKQQKRKSSREGHTNPETEGSIKSLAKNLEYAKENNEPFKLEIKKCEFCNFKTESKLAMAYHLETPHMKNFVYKCNFCPHEVRSPHDILFHMEAEHAVRGHLERAPAFHQCPNCPFEDNQKGKLSRHLVACVRKFKPERNLEAPVDWEPPAKIPRVPKMRQQGLNATVTAYQSMTKNAQYQFLSKMQLQSTQQALQRGRGRPTLGPTIKPQQTMLRPAGMVFKQQPMAGGSVLLPTNYQLSGNQVFQVVGGQDLGGRLGNPGQMFLPNTPSAIQNATQKKPTQQPSISITPLPRTTTATINPVAPAKPGDTTSKSAFVICEICDGYIKDLEQLRNHMQWIHKIKIHPKMIYNRPPLNCQKCQFRFFTDQGLERHLLGSHGLVTSSMQDAANKSKDSGRCPVCGRVYQWKLLNHVARDHNMTLKPAHLSYKCTVCTATFGMYKQFENHVYSAHSVVAKRVMDKKSASVANKSEQLKPLKINDEITIIPQPAKSNGSAKEGSPASTGSNSKSSAPSTSKNPDSTAPSTSRAERLARRNANGDV